MPSPPLLLPFQFQLQLQSPPISIHFLLSSRRPLKPHHSSFNPNFLPFQPDNLTPTPNTAPDSDETDGVIIGDCLVFDDGAFDDPFASPSPPLHPEPSHRHSKYKSKSTTATKTSSIKAQSLVPEKWKQAVEELNITKKERRRAAHQLKFGSKMERRKPPPLPDIEQYRALKPVVSDDSEELVGGEEETDVEMPVQIAEPERDSRVLPRNPRWELAARGGGSIEDIAYLFNSGKYVPGEVDSDKSPKNRRKLFSPEEKALLNKKIPDLAVATSSKWLPLHTLAASGEFYLLDALMKHNVDINAVDKDGLSAIHKAILSKKQAIMNYLLRNSANPFIRDRDGATLMHYAVQTASTQTIKILLLYNVDINLLDDYGWTPLHLAVQTQRTDIVKLLLLKGADRTSKNQDGLTPLELCLHLGHHTRTYELVKLLKCFPLSKTKSLRLLSS